MQDLKHENPQGGGRLNSQKIAVLQNFLSLRGSIATAAISKNCANTGWQNTVVSTELNHSARLSVPCGTPRHCERSVAISQTHSFNLQLFAEKEDTKKAKTKRLPLLITLLLAFVLAVVSVPVVAVISKNNATAFKTGDTSNFVEVGEIWDSNNKKFNKDNLKTLYTYLSTGYNSTGNVTATDIRGYTKGKSSGKAVVVTLGGLKWQVVYITNNASGQRTATLWLSNCEQDAFDGRSSTEGQYYGYLKSSSTGKTGLYSDWSANWDSSAFSSTYPASMYGASYIRSVTLNNGGDYATSSSAKSSFSQTTSSAFAIFTMSDYGLTNYLVQPNNMPYQKSSQKGYTFSDDLMNDSLANNLDGYYDSANSTTYNFQGNSYYKNWQNDYLWLPSMQEMGNSDTNGLWKVNNNERMNYNGSKYSTTGGKVGSVSGDAYAYSWSRSSISNTSNSVCNVYTSGSSGGSGSVNLSYAVRPALHLNLKSAVPSTVTNLSASIVGSGGSLDKTLDVSFVPSDVNTFTYTANTNYYVNKITVNNGSTTISLPISSTTPANYTTATGFNYKCYRSGDKVLVSVTNITKNLNIVGSTALLYSVSSKNSDLVLQDQTTTARANWTTSYAKIVAKYEQNSNIVLTIDNVSHKLVSSGGAGEMDVDNGTATYTFTAYNNYITIEMNLPNGPHTASIDHYTGTSTPINVSVEGGTATKSVVKVDDDLYRIFVTPEANNWVHDFNIDSNNVLVEYCEANVYRIGNATSIKYIAKDTTNVFIVELRGLFGEINFNFNLVNTQPTLKNPPSGGSILGTVVTATEGGEARIVGNDIANSENDSDTVTFVAVAYTGYTFAGWVDANDDTQFLSTLASVRLTKEQINGKVVKAIFVKTESSKVNQETNNTNDIL